MIKALELQNFQSHRRTRVELSPGVNVIVGPSDSGKTAVLRALGWVVWNRPSGDAFRSHAGGDPVARVELADGTAVTRGIDKRGGYYRLGDQELRAIRTDVPEEVARTLDLDPVNLQGQHDAPFLLSESSGEVARQLNRITRLDRIDTSLAAAASHLRELARDLKTGEAAVAAREAELESYAWVDEAELDVSSLENLEKSMAEEQRSVIGLRTLLQALAGAQTIVEMAQLEVAMAADVVPLRALAARLAEARGKAEGLRTWLRGLDSHQRTVSALTAEQTRAVQALEHARKTAPAPKTCPTCGQPWPENKRRKL